MIIIIIQIFIAYFVDDIKCHFAASMISGFVTTVASMPVDITKTRFVYILYSVLNIQFTLILLNFRIQNMKIVNGIPEYKGVFDVLVKLMRSEGFFSLWKGFTPYYARLGPHTVLIFIFLEKLRAVYYNNFVDHNMFPSV